MVYTFVTILLLSISGIQGSVGEVGSGIGSFFIPVAYTAAKGTLNAVQRVLRPTCVDELQWSLFLPEWSQAKYGSLAKIPYGLIIQQIS